MHLFMNLSHFNRQAFHNSAIHHQRKNHFNFIHRYLLYTYKGVNCHNGGISFFVCSDFTKLLAVYRDILQCYEPGQSDNPTKDAMFGMLSVFAKFERSLVKQRQAEGIAIG